VEEGKDNSLTIWAQANLIVRRGDFNIYLPLDHLTNRNSVVYFGLGY
jgi:hypothetical protein